MSDARSLLEQEKRKRRIQRFEAGTLAIVVTVVAAAVLLLGFRASPGPEPAVRPTITPAIHSEPAGWSPVRQGEVLPIHAAIKTRNGISWHDAEDASEDWIDVTKVGYRNDDPDQQFWGIRLRAVPPPTRNLPSGLVISYGLVLETNGDGVADYLVGIDTEGAKDPYHVWLTDLATGETANNFGLGSYGGPIDFSYPHASQGPFMYFTFLPLSAPPDLDKDTVRFYAWASETRGSRVVAWDLAPNDGWVSQ